MPVGTGTPTPPKPRDPAPLLLQTRDAGLSAVLCCALWQLRHSLQDMTLAIELEEVEKFQASLEHNEQKPKLQINVTHNLLVLSMVDAKTEAAIVQSESNERDLDKKEAKARLRQMADSAGQLVADHRSMIARGEESESMTRELHDMVLTMAKALR